MSDIVDRLGYHHEHPVHGTLVLRNPDGPEAATAITSLRAEVERLRAHIENDADWKFSAKRRLQLFREQRQRAETAAAEIERLRAALREIAELPGEINPSNYTHDDVVALNNAFGETWQIANAALAQERPND